MSRLRAHPASAIRRPTPCGERSRCHTVSRAARPAVPVQRVAIDEEAVGWTPEALERQLAGLGRFGFVDAGIDADEFVVGLSIPQVMEMPE